MLCDNKVDSRKIQISSLNLILSFRMRCAVTTKMISVLAHFDMLSAICLVKFHAPVKDVLKTQLDFNPL